MSGSAVVDANEGSQEHHRDMREALLHFEPPELEAEFVNESSEEDRQTTRSFVCWLAVVSTVMSLIIGPLQWTGAFRFASKECETGINIVFSILLALLVLAAVIHVVRPLRRHWQYSNLMVALLFPIFFGQRHLEQCSGQGVNVALQDRNLFEQFVFVMAFAAVAPEILHLRKATVAFVTGCLIVIFVVPLGSWWSDYKGLGHAWLLSQGREEEMDARSKTGDFIFTLFSMTVCCVIGVWQYFRGDVCRRKDYLTRVVAVKSHNRLVRLLQLLLPTTVLDKLAVKEATLESSSVSITPFQSPSTSSIGAESHDHAAVLFLKVNIGQYLDHVASHGADMEAGLGQQATFDLVAFLNDLFREWDGLVENAGAFKVETVGSEYVVTAGVPYTTGTQQPSVLLCNIAIEMVMECRSRCWPGGGDVEVSCGIHCGPIVSGVLGRRLPRYRLFGDTMNTASRMCSHANPFEIKVSAAVFERVRGEVPLTSVGTIEAKGKGTMQTFAVKGPHSGSSSGSRPASQSGSRGSSRRSSSHDTGLSGLHIDWAELAMEVPSSNVHGASNVKIGGKSVNIDCLLGMGMPSKATMPALAAATSSTVAEPRPRLLPSLEHLPALPTLPVLPGSHGGGQLTLELQPLPTMNPSHGSAPSTPPHLGSAGITTLQGSPTTPTLKHAMTPHKLQTLWTPDSPGVAILPEPVMSHPSELKNYSGGASPIAAASPVMSASYKVDPLSPKVGSGSDVLTAVILGQQNVPPGTSQVGTTMPITSVSEDVLDVVVKDAVSDESRQGTTLLFLEQLSKLAASANTLGQRRSWLRVVVDWTLGPAPKFGSSLEKYFVQVYAPIGSREMQSHRRALTSIFAVLSFLQAIVAISQASACSGEFAVGVFAGQLLLALGVTVANVVVAYTLHTRPTAHPRLFAAACVWTSVLQACLSLCDAALVGGRTRLDEATSGFVTTADVDPVACGPLGSHSWSTYRMLVCIICITATSSSDLDVYAVNWTQPIMWVSVLVTGVCSGAVHSILTLFAAALMLLICSIRHCRKVDRRRRRQFVSLINVEIGRQRARLMMQSMLPSVVLTTMIRDGTFYAAACPNVATLFADLTQFTALASKLSARRVMMFLTELFEVFDSLAEAAGVTKVETIGDCYWAACESTEDMVGDENILAITRVALDLRRGLKALVLKLMEQSILPNEASEVDLRVGIHYGPAVAGVVGRTMPRYHYFGPTVDIAEQLEQDCPVGSVLASDQLATKLPAGQFISRPLDPACHVQGGKRRLYTKCVEIRGEVGKPLPRSPPTAGSSSSVANPDAWTDAGNAAQSQPAQDVSTAFGTALSGEDIPSVVDQV